MIIKEAEGKTWKIVGSKSLGFLVSPFHIYKIKPETSLNIDSNSKHAQ